MQPLTASTGNGVHRSNTVPSKRLVSSGSRLQKSPIPHSQQSSVTHTPVAAASTQPQASSALASAPPPIGIFRSPIEDGHTASSPSSHHDPAVPRQFENAALSNPSGSVPSMSQSAGAQSQDRLLPSNESSENNVVPTTPQKEQGNFFLRATSTSDSEKRPPPNKLRKKRLPSSQNPSAQSSSQSLSLRQVSGEHSPSGHDRIPLNAPHDDPSRLESIPSGHALNAMSPGVCSPLANPMAQHPVAVSAGMSAQGGPQGGPQSQPLPPPQPAYLQGQYDGALKTQESATSLDSHNIPNTSNEHSEIDPMTDDAGISSGGEQKEKRNIWRMSRRPKEDKDKKEKSNEPGRLSPGSPKKSAIGGNNGAEASTTSFGSGQGWRKSFQQEQMPNMDTLANEPSNGTGISSGGDRDKKGMVGWLKGKIRGDDDKRGRDSGRDGRGRTGSEQSQPNDFGNRSSELRSNTQGEGIPEVRETTGRAPLE